MVAVIVAGLVIVMAPVFIESAATCEGGSAKTHRQHQAGNN